MTRKIVKRSIFFFNQIKFKIFFYPGGSCSGRFFPRPGELLKIDLSFNYNLAYDINDLFPDFLNNFKGRKIRVTAPSRVLFSLEIEIHQKAWRLKRGQHKLV